MPNDAPRPEDPRNDPGIRAAVNAMMRWYWDGWSLESVEAALYRAIEEWHRRLMPETQQEWAERMERENGHLDC